MNNLKQILYIAFLMLLFLTGCSNEEDIIGGSNGNGVTIGLSVLNGEEVTRAGVSAFSNESLITNIFLLFYEKNAEDTALPSFFFSESGLTALGTWSKDFDDTFRNLAKGTVYDVYALASLPKGTSKPTKRTTKGSLLAMTEKQFERSADNPGISFSGTGEYIGGTENGQIEIALLRTVARLDITFVNINQPGMSIEAMIEKSPVYTPYQPTGTATAEWRNQMMSPLPDGMTFRGYIYENKAGGTMPSLHATLMNPGDKSQVYTGLINEENGGLIERNKIYKLKAALSPTGKLIIVESTAIDWEDNVVITPPAATPDALEEANTYILQPGGKTVFIPVSQANRPRAEDNIPSIGEADVLTAEVIWTDVKGAVSKKGMASDAAVQDIRVIGVGNKAFLQISSGTEAGNVIVAVKKEDVIVWSWHIWVTDYDPGKADGQKTMNGYVFMDRNLGAINVTPGDIQGNGLFYQWGRKDGFPGSGDFTSNGIANYSWRKPVYYADGTLVPTDTQRQSGGTAPTLQTVVQNPVKIYMPTGNRWSSETYPAMWGAGSGKSVYDPCPAGWRIPELAAFAGMTTANSPLVTSNYGRLNADLGYFPFAGMATDDAVTSYKIGTSTVLLSNSGATDTCNGVYIDNSQINLNYTDKQERLYSVRCVKE